jgi:glutamine synthetase
MADGADASRLTGPDTIDCIAPAQGWEAFWQDQVQGQARGRALAARADRRDRHLSASPRPAACTTRARGGLRQLLQRLREHGIEQVRIGWCDLHGTLRGKTLMPAALPSALRDGVGMVSTLLLKDTSDRTAFKVFEAATQDELPGFGQAGNLLLLPDPDSLVLLPWAPGTGLAARAALVRRRHAGAGRPAPCAAACAGRLAAAGYGLQCGLEVEFHIYRITTNGSTRRPRPGPGEPPRVQLLHPGYNLLSEAWADRATRRWPSCAAPRRAWACRCARWRSSSAPASSRRCSTPADALTAADRMVLFRNGVRRRLRRAGYHATFMCRPPFERPCPAAGTCTSRWSTWPAAAMPSCATKRPAPVRRDARQVLSDTGAHWLAGLLAHAGAAAVFGCSTVNAFGRFRPNALAPLAALWGRDNRGAMLRVLGGPGDGATRIENRIGEPMANPYLYMASQIHAGLDGLRQRGCDPRRPPNHPMPTARCGAARPGWTTRCKPCRQPGAACRPSGDDLVKVCCRIKRARHAPRRADDSASGSAVSTSAGTKVPIRCSNTISTKLHILPRAPARARARGAP